jgi:hypothetical protein
MKEQEFIELLNLYLDHEISGTDAARLEAEVRGDVGRRATYNQYCRMHKACTALGAEFAAAHEVAFNPATAELAHAARRRHSAYFGLATLAAAAACVALVFVGRKQTAIQAQSAVAAVAPASSAVDVGVPARAVGIVQRPMLMADPLLLSRLNRSDAEVVAVAQQVPAQLAWIQGVRLAPLQLGATAADLRFQAAPASLRPDARNLVTQPAAGETAVEMAAFRFQK